MPTGHLKSKVVKMYKKQVAIIDVGSSELRAVVAESGVNNTFIIKGKKTFSYDGFSSGAFFDIDILKSALLSAGDYLKRVARKDVDTVFVGVPGDFTQIIVKDSQISFEKSKKITEEDVDKLYDGAFVSPSAKTTLINRSAVVYELGDFRRLANPIGSQSEILKGKLSFIVCDNYFIECFKPALKACGFNNVEFVSTPLAEAMYLFDAESRDRISILVDVGYITTTLSVVQGDGIVYQYTFDYGGGYITGVISQSFDIDFDDAEILKRKINLSRITDGNPLEILDGNKGRYYSISELKNIVSTCIDNFCEEISNALDKVGFNIPEYVPLKITGGGIAFIRGAKEHVANRLGMSVELIAPAVPLMDSPLESAVLSLLDIALQQ